MPDPWDSRIFGVNRHFRDIVSYSFQRHGSFLILTGFGFSLQCSKFSLTKQYSIPMGFCQGMLPLQEPDHTEDRNDLEPEEIRLSRQMHNRFCELLLLKSSFDNGVRKWYYKTMMCSFSGISPITSCTSFLFFKEDFMEETRQKNKMGTAPVKKLMLSMGVPMIVSMVLQAVYNIVDSAFVSNMAIGGEDALNALTLAFPLQILMVAVGIGTGVGANVLVAKSLGQGNHQQANKAAGNAVFLALVISIGFLLFGIFGSEYYIHSQTSNPVIAEMGTDYLRICCVFSFGMSFFAVYEKLLQATGHSVCSTIAQISGAVTNIVLDPILIYGWLGCPELGVKGAAYATVIGQIVSFAVALAFHWKVNQSISNKLDDFKPSASIIRMIYSIGLPAIISQALISVMTYGLNLILGGISETMVTAYGLYYKIQQFLLFAAFGMRDAIMPITAFSFGMGDPKRVRDCVKYGQLYTGIIMVAGFLALELLAEPFSGLFGLSGETQSLCISAMHIISICFVFAGMNIAFQGVFQALGGGLESLVVSVCRQLLFVFALAIPFAAAVKANTDMNWLMWTVFPIAEGLTTIVAILLFRRINQKKITDLQRAELPLHRRCPSS